MADPRSSGLPSAPSLAHSGDLEALASRIAAALAQELREQVGLAVAAEGAALGERLERAVRSAVSDCVGKPEDSCDRALFRHAGQSHIPPRKCHGDGSPQQLPLQTPIHVVTMRERLEVLACRRQASNPAPPAEPHFATVDALVPLGPYTEAARPPVGEPVAQTHTDLSCSTDSAATMERGGPPSRNTLPPPDYFMQHRATDSRSQASESGTSGTGSSGASEARMYSVPSTIGSSYGSNSSGRQSNYSGLGLALSTLEDAIADCVLESARFSAFRRRPSSPRSLPRPPMASVNSSSSDGSRLLRQAPRPLASLRNHEEDSDKSVEVINHRQPNEEPLAAARHGPRQGGSPPFPFPHPPRGAEGNTQQLGIGLRIADVFRCFTSPRGRVCPGPTPDREVLAEADASLATPWPSSGGPRAPEAHAWRNAYSAASAASASSAASAMSAARSEVAAQEPAMRSELSSVPLYCFGVHPWTVREPRGCHGQLARAHWLLVLLVLMAALAGCVEQVVATRPLGQMASSMCYGASCLRLGLFSHIPVALGGVATFLSLTWRNGGRYHVSVLALHRAFIRRHGYRSRWVQESRRDAAVLMVLWVAVLATHCWSTGALPTVLAGHPLDSLSAVQLFAFLVPATVLLAATMCVMRMCRAMAAAVDAYACTTLDGRDVSFALEEWNILVALLGKGSSEVNHCLFLLQATAITMLLCCFPDSWDTSEAHFSLLVLLPGAFLGLAVAAAFICAASVTDRCSRVPRVINSVSICSGSKEWSRVVDAISHSSAGLYVYEVRLTFGLVLRFLYIFAVASSTLAIHALGLSKL